MDFLVEQISEELGRSRTSHGEAEQKYENKKKGEKAAEQNDGRRKSRNKKGENKTITSQKLAFSIACG